MGGFNHRGAFSQVAHFGRSKKVAAAMIKLASMPWGAEPMSRFKALGAVATTVVLAGCTYNVQTLSAPQLNVYSNYTNRVQVGGHSL